MKELYIVRHGETQENLEEVVQGQTDGRLTDKGRVQARALGESLRNIGVEFSIIFSSPLNRAYQTAIEIQKCLGRVPIILTDNLKERGFGEYQGRSLAGMARDYGIEFNKGDSPLVEAELYAYDTGDIKIARTWEPLAHVKGRAKAFLKESLGYPPLGYPKEGVMLISGHGWINSYLTNLLLGENIVWHPQGNAHVNYFKVDDGGKVVGYHLNTNPKDLKTG